jgi:hypothetical protein
MTTYKTAQEVLIAAVADPDDPEKLKAAKEHPKLKETLKGFTKTDMRVLNKVASARRRGGPPDWSCSDSRTA